MFIVRFFFFKQKTAFEMRISDWSSDVCSSDLLARISSLSGVASGALVDSAAVERLSALGLITREGGRLGVLPPGMLLLDAILPEIVARSEARRVGKECGSTCRSRCAPDQ